MRANPQSHIASHSSSRFTYMALCALGIIAFAVGLSGPACADEITTTNGQRVSGTVIDESDAAIVVQTTTGKLTLAKARIKSIKRENVGEDEARGDLAIARRDYYEALKDFELAHDRKEGSGELDRKIKETRQRINQKERDLYDSLFQKAIQESAQGDRTAARQTLESIMSQAPKDGPSWRKARMGIALQYYGDALAAVDRVEYQQAIDCLEQGIQKDPDLAILELQLARYLVKYTDERTGVLEHYEKGIRLGNKFLAMDEAERKDLDSITPREARIDKALVNECRFERAEQLLGLGKKSEAADEFMALFQQDPKNYNKGTKYIIEIYTSDDSKMDYNRVLKGLDVALTLDKTSARAWFLKGRIFLDTGHPREAIEALGKAIELDPNMAESHYMRAKARLLLGEAVQARKDLEEELKILETYQLRCELGKVLLIGAEYDKALENYNRAIQMDPEKFPARIGRARTYRIEAMATKVSQARKDELLNQAKDDIEMVRKKSEKNKEAILEMGRLLRDQQKKEDAVSNFKTVIDDMKALGDRMKADDKQLLAEAYAERGSILLDNDDKNQAEVDFQEALKYNSNFALAYSKLGEVAQKNKKYNEALTNYTKAIDLGHDNADFELQIGLLYQEYIKDYKNALIHYQAYEKKGGGNPRVKDYINQCNLALKSE